MILCSSTYDPMFVQGMPVKLMEVSTSESESDDDADDDDDSRDSTKQTVKSDDDARDSTEQEVNRLFNTSDEDGEKEKEEEKKKPTKTKKQLARQQRAQEWQRIKARVTLVLKDKPADNPKDYAEYYTFVRDVSHIYFNTMKKNDRLHLDREQIISSAVHTVFDGNPTLICLSSYACLLIILCLFAYHPMPVCLSSYVYILSRKKSGPAAIRRFK